STDLLFCPVSVPSISWNFCLFTLQESDAFVKANLRRPNHIVERGTMVNMPMTNPRILLWFNSYSVKGKFQ
ncbi:MAG: hypothetical protein WBZ20_02470, partial [Nitrososphaeraceae archaeon]